MENISKFLYWTMGVLLTLAIISTGLLLWARAQPIGAAAQRQAEDQARMMSEAQFAAYDNQIVSGSQLVTAYRRYYSLNGFHLYVEKNGGAVRFGMTPNGSGSTCPSIDFGTGTLSGGTMSNCGVTETTVTTSAATEYIPPQTRFRTTLVRDANHRVTGIYFKML
jgi:hypothetical protein